MAKESVPSALTHRLKLSVKERLNIEGLLPPSGTRTAMSLVEDILSKIEVGQKEQEEIGMAPRFNNRGDQIGWTWNPQKEKARVVEFTNAEIKFLQDQADAMDKKATLTLPLYQLVKKLDDIKLSEPN